MSVSDNSVEIDREKAIDSLESQFPDLFEAAVRAASWNTLAAGQSVLEAENGFIYEVFPDGTRNIIKQIAPPIIVDVGQRIGIQ